MEKKSARTALLVLIGAASISSYVYLQQVKQLETYRDTSQITLEQEEPTETLQQEITLPDVQMIKKLVETGKRLIPGS